MKYNLSILQICFFLRFFGFNNFFFLIFNVVLNAQFLFVFAYIRQSYTISSEPYRGGGARAPGVSFKRRQKVHQNNLIIPIHPPYKMFKILIQYNNNKMIK